MLQLLECGAGYEEERAAEFTRAQEESDSEDEELGGWSRDDLSLCALQCHCSVGEYAATLGAGCPLNVCCSQYGFLVPLIIGCVIAQYLGGFYPSSRVGGEKVSSRASSEISGRSAADEEAVTWLLMVAFARDVEDLGAALARWSARSKRASN